MGVAGLVIVLVEFIKTALEPRVNPVLMPKLIPILVLGLSMAIFVSVSMMYPNFDPMTALRDGFVLGLLSSGIYGLGKAVIEKLPVQPEQPSP
jgi:hypothetical protein